MSTFKCIIISQLYKCSCSSLVLHFYRVYAVIVVTGDLLRTNDNSARRRRQNDNTLRSPSDIINDMGGVLPEPYNVTNPMDIYTAAVWNRAEDVPEMFIVGNGSMTRGPDGRVYVNAELAEGTEYGVFNYIRLESDNAVSLTVFVCVFYI